MSRFMVERSGHPITNNGFAIGSNVGQTKAFKPDQAGERVRRRQNPVDGAQRRKPTRQRKVGDHTQKTSTWQVMKSIFLRAHPLNGSRRRQSALTFAQQQARGLTSATTGF